MSEVLRCSRCGAHVAEIQYRCAACRKVLQSPRGDASSALRDAACAVALVVGVFVGLIATVFFTTNNGVADLFEGAQRLLAVSHNQADVTSLLLIFGTALVSIIFVLALGKKK